jgi:hypothetical protein
MRRRYVEKDCVFDRIPLPVLWFEKAIKADTERDTISRSGLLEPAGSRERLRDRTIDFANDGISVLNSRVIVPNIDREMRSDLASALYLACLLEKKEGRTAEKKYPHSLLYPSLSSSPALKPLSTPAWFRVTERQVHEAHPSVADRPTASVGNIVIGVSSRMEVLHMGSMALS